MAGNFFRGVSAEQDGRYVKAEEKLLLKLKKEKKFPINFDTNVDFNKVNIDVLSRWVVEKITQLLGFEDEILSNLVINTLSTKKVDPFKLQLDITGFLVDDAKEFMQELWDLAIDAQSQPTGIPTVFIQQKKEEILKNTKSVLVIEKQSNQTKWKSDNNDNKSYDDSSKIPKRKDSRDYDNDRDRKHSRQSDIYDDRRRRDDSRDRYHERYDRDDRYHDKSDRKDSRKLERSDRRKEKRRSYSRSPKRDRKSRDKERSRSRSLSRSPKRDRKYRDKLRSRSRSISEEKLPDKSTKNED